ncbi:MAG TPA: GPW/gp25 family protein [Candidatus Cybelea sp.]|nr:GPW/gp25 family protein [Candidatus Cybelea sp.]
MSESDFRGQGWRFPIQIDAGGGLGYVEGDANIEQSLKILLLTGLGERVMRPTFGCAAPRLVFAPGSVQYLRLLETTIREAVRDWEPRVTLDDVTAEALPTDETRVNVNISYRVRGSNTKNNLVFPFYLGQTEVNG